MATLEQGFDDYVEAARTLLSSYESISDLWEANSCINQALRLRPAHAGAWVLKSQLMSSLEDDLAALATAEMAVGLDPRSAEAHYVRGAALADLERYDDALAAIDVALDVVDDDEEWLLEDLLYERATLLDALGRSDDAVAAFEQGLRRFPDSVLLQSGLEPLRREKLRGRLRVIEGGARSRRQPGSFNPN